MKKLIFIFVSVILLAGCSNEEQKKQEYINMASSVNKSITNFETTFNSLYKVSSAGIYRRLKPSNDSIKDKAIDAISKIDKINNLEYKIPEINELFLDMRGTIKDELYVASGGTCSFTTIGQLCVLMQKNTNYIKQYDVESRITIINK